MAGYYDFQVEKGTTFKRTLGWRVGGMPVDVTGFTAVLEVRKSQSSPTPDFYLDSNKDGGLIIGGADGRIDIFVQPAWSQAVPKGIYFYWLDINTGDETDRLLEGRVTIKEGVSQ